MTNGVGYITPTRAGAAGFSDGAWSTGATLTVRRFTAPLQHEVTARTVRAVRPTRGLARPRFFFVEPLYLGAQKSRKRISVYRVTRTSAFYKIDTSGSVVLHFLYEHCYKHMSCKLDSIEWLTLNFEAAWYVVRAFIIPTFFATEIRHHRAGTPPA